MERSLDPAQLGARTQRLYEADAEVAHFSTLVEQGLFDFERELATRHLGQGDKILDVGCGAGREAFGLEQLGWRVVGTDISQAMVRTAVELASQRDSACHFVPVGDGPMPFRAATFDAALLFNFVVQLIPGTAARCLVFRELHRILRPGGVLLVVSYAHSPMDWIWHLHRRVQGTDSAQRGLAASAAVASRRILGLPRRASVRLLDAGRGLAGRILGHRYRGLEPGDRLKQVTVSSERTYFRDFRARELIDEIRSCGFDLAQRYCLTELSDGRTLPRPVAAASPLLGLAFRAMPSSDGKVDGG